MKPENPEDQIILIDKPAGISSFGVVAKVRGQLKQEFGHKIKVGHTGTLDPFATGLMILLSGKFTKKSNDFLKKDKVYEATLKLGYISTTGDPEGQIQPYLTKDLPEVITEDEGASPAKTGTSNSYPKLSEIEFVLSCFVGEIKQTPPRFSAIKINGERAYKLARKNQDFKIPARKVTIYSIDILDYNYPILKIRCHVSSGTYIRTLAEDIGKKLKTGAYCEELRRTKIGDYNIEDAKKLVL
ncbi:MAG: tRNA pseudouridine(55) synthase TruB [Candidatus Saccharibacteria bacterium]|nr:tRNA pseudouridine(55) synthase TruB [Candidatus Saccharibacteria bacterium]